MRLINNRHDDAAFERVINTPTRGIGDKTLSLVREVARSQNLALWQAIKKFIGAKNIACKGTASLSWIYVFN